MRRVCPTWICVISIRALTSQQQMAGGELAHLTVSITDYANTPPRTLIQAQQVAAELLARGGVKSSWKLCPTSSDAAAARHRACVEEGPLTLSARVLPSRKAARWPIDKNSCGIALTGEEWEFGFLAVIDGGCVMTRSGPRPGAVGRFLGHVIAHELGHLLLGRGSHAAAGLMSSKWSSEEQMLITRGELEFGIEEAARLREAMIARSKALDLRRHSDERREQPRAGEPPGRDPPRGIQHAFAQEKSESDPGARDPTQAIRRDHAGRHPIAFCDLIAAKD